MYTNHLNFVSHRKPLMRVQSVKLWTRYLFMHKRAKVLLFASQELQQVSTRISKDVSFALQVSQTLRTNISDNGSSTWSLINSIPTSAWIRWPLAVGLRPHEVLCALLARSYYGQIAFVRNAALVIRFQGTASTPTHNGYLLRSANIWRKNNDIHIMMPPKVLKIYYLSVHYSAEICFDCL